MYHIRDLQLEEKPREKLVNIGAKNLTNVELLAIILGSGGKDYSVIETARNLLNSHQGLSGLINASITELRKTKYVGKVNALKIIALGELGLRINQLQKTKGLKIKDPKDIHTLLKPEIYNNKQETLYLISLDTRNNFIEKDVITIGTINETLVHPREIFLKALERKAVYIIIAHNHPSDNTHPSTQDLVVTTRIAKAGKYIGIPLLDHVVVSKNEYTSIKREYLSDLSKLDSKEVIENK